jgi:ferredoxin
MSYIVTDACVRCKYMDCIEVCPVDCFYEGPSFIVINPDECIDCGVCEPECPVNAIKPQAEEDPDGKWLTINSRLATLWPNITKRGEVPDDADDYRDEADKFERYVADEQADQGPATV